MQYRVKYTESFVCKRISDKVKDLCEKGVLTPRTVYLVMLNGGLWFAARLLGELKDPQNKVFTIKGHSYQGIKRGNFNWDLLPEDKDIIGKDLVVLDDICDSGATINAMYHYFKDKVASIHFVTLLGRSSRCLDEGVCLDCCIEDCSDDFFVGCGLDNNEDCRFLPYVCVLEIEN